MLFEWPKCEENNYKDEHILCCHVKSLMYMMIEGSNWKAMCLCEINQFGEFMSMLKQIEELS